MRKIYARGLLPFLLLFSAIQITMAQSPAPATTQKSKGIEIKGRVVDAETTDPLAGAVISVAGTSKGVTADANGQFTLRANEGDELVVSFMGMVAQRKKILANAVNQIIALIRDSKAIDDIVVVGYGTRQKSLITGAIETVKSDMLVQQATNRLDEAIMGQTAGVFVSNDSSDPSSLGQVTIRVRGNKGNDAAPLLVIDGTPRFGTFVSDGEMRLPDINPNDVESISILKDAAAAAIYGSRAANGVILVTTKRGEMNKKATIRYSGKANLQQAIMMPDFVDNYQFAKMFNQALDNTKTVPTGINKYTNEELEQIRTNSNPDIFANEDLTKYLKKLGYSTSHTVSVSGGTKDVSYYASGSYTSNSGLYSGVKNNKFNYNLRLDAKLLKGLDLSFDVMGSGFDSKNPSFQTISSIYSFSPLQPLIWSNGSLVSIGGSNPLVGIRGLGGYNQHKSSYNTTTAKLNYDLDFITKGLSIYIKGSFDSNIYESRDFSKPERLYLKDHNTGIISLDNKTIYPQAKNSMKQNSQKTNNMLLEGGVNYNRSFKKHSISALAIFNYQQNKISTMRADNEDIPSWPESVGASSPVGGATDGFSQRASMVGRLNYSYDTRYIIEGSFRLDGSTKFHPDHRWGFFPTVSLAWNLTNEQFFKDWSQKVISNTKIRFSTGLLGNDGAITDFAYMYNYMLGNQSYQIGGAPETSGLMPQTGHVPNPVLQWGKSKDYNAGIDLGFFDNRLTASIEYYCRFNTNDIRSTPSHLYPPSMGTGYSTPMQNYGKTKTWGYDLTIGWRDRIGKNASYYVDFMMSRSWDKTIDAGDESTLAPERRLAGKPISSSWMYVSDGLFQSQQEIDNLPFDQDGKGNTTLVPGDIRYKHFPVEGEGADGKKPKLGENDKRAFEYISIPDFALNMRFGFDYKGFFVNGLLQGVLHYMKDVSESYTLLDGAIPRFQTYHMTDSWSTENRDAKYPIMRFHTKSDNNKFSSDYWFRDASYLRLRTLNLGYTLPSKYLRNVKLSTVSIALQGGNLFTICSLKGIDPDTGRGYPTTRTYGVTINLGF